MWLILLLLVDYHWPLSRYNESGEFSRTWTNQLFKAGVQLRGISQAWFAAVTTIATKKLAVTAVGFVSNRQITSICTQTHSSNTVYFPNFLIASKDKLNAMFPWVMCATKNDSHDRANLSLYAHFPNKACYPNELQNLLPCSQRYITCRHRSFVPSARILIWTIVTISTGSRT